MCVCVCVCPRLIACRDEGRGRQSEGADDRSAVGSWRLEDGVWKLEATEGRAAEKVKGRGAALGRRWLRIEAGWIRRSAAQDPPREQ